MRISDGKTEGKMNMNDSAHLIRVTLLGSAKFVKLANGDNRLKGISGEKINALLCGGGNNKRIILRRLRGIVLFFFYFVVIEQLRVS